MGILSRLFGYGQTDRTTAITRLAAFAQTYAGPVTAGARDNQVKLAALRVEKLLGFPHYFGAVVIEKPVHELALNHFSVFYG